MVVFCTKSFFKDLLRIMTKILSIKVILRAINDITIAKKKFLKRFHCYFFLPKMDVTFRSYLSQNWLNTNVYLTILVNRLRLKAFIFVRKFRFGWHLRYDIKEGVCYIGTQVWSEKKFNSILTVNHACIKCLIVVLCKILLCFLKLFSALVQIIENLKYGTVQNVCIYFFISDNKGKGKRYRR